MVNLHTSKDNEIIECFSILKKLLLKLRHEIKPFLLFTVLKDIATTKDKQSL